MSNYSTAGTWDTTTTTDATNNVYNFSTDGAIWFPYYLESTWEPYEETNYTPKWHITQGYKKQMNTMWD